MSVYVFKYICVCSTNRTEKGVGSRQTGVMDHCELTCECWELNLALNHSAISSAHLFFNLLKDRKISEM